MTFEKNTEKTAEEKQLLHLTQTHHRLVSCYFHTEKKIRQSHFTTKLALFYEPFLVGSWQAARSLHLDIW